MKFYRNFVIISAVTEDDVFTVEAASINEIECQFTGMGAR
jgi:hypothetical protein